MTNIAERLNHIRLRMARAAEKSGRTTEDIQLIAVSKGHETKDVVSAIIAGQKIFGENRVQEAQKKFLPLKPIYTDLELHLIGALQTNKCDDAVALFDVIHTLDRPKLAEALAKSMRKIERTPKIFIEVNIGNEPQKAGLEPSALPEFIDYCRTKCGLDIEGLMCIPPHNNETARWFQLLHTLAERHNLKHLSMGMSGDFEQAIACGATCVRIGTAIFGKRVEKNREN